MKNVIDVFLNKRMLINYIKANLDKPNNFLYITNIQMAELASLETAPVFTLENLETNVKVIDVYDGDTFTVLADIGPHFGADTCIRAIKCRAFGYNCAEIRTRDAAEKARGMAIRDMLCEKLMGKVFKAKFGPFDNFGRPLIDLYIETPGEKAPTAQLSTYMINNGYATEYKGNEQKKWV